MFYVWMFGGSAFVAELVYQFAVKVKLIGKPIAAVVLAALMASGNRQYSLTNPRLLQRP